MISKILKEKEKDTFCNELNISNDASKILLKINNNKAIYFNGKDYHDIELKIAKKYI